MRVTELSEMKQVRESHRFKVGAFNCIAVSDGTHTYSPPTFPPPPVTLFANAPREDLTPILHRHHLDPESWMGWVSPYTCLVIETGEAVVLVDTGAGSLGPDTGKLMRVLRSEQISPRDIDAVILTHGHPDHIGGNTVNGEPAFPDARFAMWRGEWEFWTSGEAEQRLGHGKEVLLGSAHVNLPPIKGQVDLIECESEVVPGIRAIAAPGHTPGHMALEAESGGERLLCVSDAFLHPIHVERPDWYSIFDLSPSQLTDTRRRLLGMASGSGALVFAFHFPFPGLGGFSRVGEAWRWEPLAADA
jgi:glyoxylase-like metal-dependent hydrolase (beta-lactamase superfamily II)